MLKGKQTHFYIKALCIFMMTNKVGFPPWHLIWNNASYYRMLCDFDSVSYSMINLPFVNFNVRFILI